VDGTIPGVRAGLQQILDLEQIEDLVFRGRSREGVTETRVFGGEVAGQALVAAARTVQPDRTVHSLHAYFLRPGDPSRPILYQVDPIRDGRSFTTRRVVGVQRGEAIFTLSASFQVHEDGLHHQVPVLDAAPPEDLPPVTEAPGRPEDWFARFPIELRFPDGPPGVVPGDNVPPRQLTSLDHAVWFHAPFRADDWLCYQQEGTWAGNARALCRGYLFDRRGTLVATVMQEGLIRLRDGKVPGPAGS
jgi:acyl-CoA thioesterase-2